MANFRDKSDECFDEPRYGCLSEAFHDFGVSIPRMSGKMAEAVMDDFFELLGKKNKGESSKKDEPKEHPYSGIVEFQEYGLNCVEVVYVLAESDFKAYKKVIEMYKNKNLNNYTLNKMSDDKIEEVADRIRLEETLGWKV